MSLIERMKLAYSRLSIENKEELLRFVISAIPKGRKLRDIVKPNSQATPFDLDLIDGLMGESAFLNIATPGKYEIKRDFKVSDTGRIAVEVECRGKLSCLSITEAPYWVYWLSGEEYQDEVAVVITVARLKRITESWYVVNGGDDNASTLRIGNVHRLLDSNSDIDQAMKRFNRQMGLNW